MISPITLNNSIKYQEGSVVSKELAKNSSGTITLFAFAKDQGLSEHSAPFDAHVLVTEGEADISVGGTLYQVEEGQMLTMPANTPHSLKATKPFKMLLTMIKA